MACCQQECTQPASLWYPAGGCPGLLGGCKARGQELLHLCKALHETFYMETSNTLKSLLGCRICRKKLSTQLQLGSCSQPSSNPLSSLLWKARRGRGALPITPVLIFIFHGSRVSTSISFSLLHPSSLKVRRKKCEAEVTKYQRHSSHHFAQYPAAEKLNSPSPSSKY